MMSKQGLNGSDGFRAPFGEHGTTGSELPLLLIISGHQRSSAVSTELLAKAKVSQREKLTHLRRFAPFRFAQPWQIQVTSTAATRSAGRKSPRLQTEIAACQS